MVEESSDHGNSRRQFLIRAGVGGLAAGLAGCSGDGGDGNDSDGGTDGGDGTTTTTGSGGEPVDPAFTAGSWMIPDNGQMNPWNLKNYTWGAGMMFDQLAVFNRRTQEWLPSLAEDWTIEGNTMTISLKERSWQNGDPVTAGDLATQFRLEKIVQNPIWELLDSVEATGDGTFEITLQNDTTNKTVLQWQVLPTMVRAPTRVFGKHVKAYQEASSEDERKTVRENLINRTISYDNAFGNGPFQFESANSQKGVLTKFEGHPASDGINFPRYEFIYVPSNQKRWSALKSLETDGYGSTYVPPKVVKGFPDAVEEILIRTYGNYAMAIQYDHEFYGDRRVRQGLTYALDRKPIAKAVGPRTREYVPWVLGTANSTREQFFPDSMLEGSGFKSYETDREQAAKLFREAGLKKEDGNWVKPDGSVLKGRFKVHAGFSDFISGTQVAVSQMKDFGIDATMIPVEGTAYGAAYREADWEFFAPGWGQAIPYPYFNYERAMASQEAHQYNGYPTEVEVPSEVGNIDSETETVNVDDLVASIARSRGEDANRLIRKAGWVYNLTIPKLPLNVRLNQYWMTRDDWEFPAKDADVNGVISPRQWLPRVGKLKAKTQ